LTSLSLLPSFLLLPPPCPHSLPPPSCYEPSPTCPFQPALCFLQESSLCLPHHQQHLGLQFRLHPNNRALGPCPGKIIFLKHPRKIL
jgi:hypothetical protein